MDDIVHFSMDHGSPAHEPPAHESPARITRVRLRNYKSIVSCDVELQPLTILVGPNGSGKSNFVDALRFVSEALTVGLDQAIRSRGNLSRILSEARVADSTSFSVELFLYFGPGDEGRFSFKVEQTTDGGFRVAHEILKRSGGTSSVGGTLYEICPDGARVWDPKGIAREHLLVHDRLFLVNYSSMFAARPTYDVLTSMCFYSLEPSQMRTLLPSVPDQRLLPDGSNVSSMVRRIAGKDTEILERITAYLSSVLPGLKEIRAEDLRGYDLLSLRQAIATERGWWDAYPEQLSEGTLRALGVLVALFQGRLEGPSSTSLVAIEEPEAGLHPAAADSLFNALLDASWTHQVVVTTYSTDLLQSSDLEVGSLLAVIANDGVTEIGPIDDLGRSVLRDKLYSAGELLQMKLLRPTIRPNGSSSAAAAQTPASIG